ncbi:MAG: prepilin-type N-terminal cleavage/methylation domain-containing protein [Nitrospirae bacterium]|nr:MAG: prepilin-type N-terminal cleavage/methylation domain-containing protein [Nitrospirota bacterium]
MEEEIATKQVTTTSIKQYQSSPGFTFIELMVVLAILSVGMFVIMPKVVGGMLEKSQPLTAELNALLKEAKNRAVKERVRVDIRFVLGGEHYFFEDHEYTLPGGRQLQRAWVNEHQASGLEFRIHAYPAGVCDYFVLELGEKVKLKSNPLLCEVRVETG